MTVLRINGYAVAGRIGYNQNYTDIASRRDYSPNGLYQLGRNGVARSWKFSTRPLPRDEAIALAMMLSHHGDAWVWGLSSDPDGVVYVTDDTAPEVWSDARRLPQAAEASCSVVSAYGADGARVYDWNGNAYAPFDSCEGALLVEPGTTNKVAASAADCSAVTEFGIIAGATRATNTTKKWEGSGCIAVTVPSSAGNYGVRVPATTTIAEVSGGHVMSAYIRFDGDLINAGNSLVIQYYNVTAGTSVATDTITPTLSDAWYRATISGSTTVGNTIEMRLYITNPGAAANFYVDGVQIEADVNDGYPTAWVDSGADPWGSGNGVRDNGVLDFDTFVASYTKGFTLSAWVNVQYLAATSNRYLLDLGDNNPRAYIYITSTTNILYFVVAASDGSSLVTAYTIPSVGWYHITAAYDAANATAYLYQNGVLSQSDATWSGARKFFDIANLGGDLSIGTAGAAGSAEAKCPLGPVSVYPFAMPADMVASMYNSAADNRPVPGVYPLAVEGDMLGAGEEQLYCYAQVTNMRNAPYQLDGGAWEPGAMEVEFELFEATARVS